MPPREPSKSPSKSVDDDGLWSTALCDVQSGRWQGAWPPKMAGMWRGLSRDPGEDQGRMELSGCAPECSGRLGVGSTPLAAPWVGLGAGHRLARAAERSRRPRILQDRVVGDVRWGRPHSGQGDCSRTIFRKTAQVADAASPICPQRASASVPSTLPGLPALCPAGPDWDGDELGMLGPPSMPEREVSGNLYPGVQTH